MSDYRREYEEKTGKGALAVENGVVLGYYTNDCVYWLESRLAEIIESAKNALNDKDNEIVWLESERDKNKIRIEETEAQNKKLVELLNKYLNSGNKKDINLTVEVFDYLAGLKQIGGN